jgi:protein-S-isoprenylcysteine O-methyltransferase Ste14
MTSLELRVQPVAVALIFGAIMWLVAWVWPVALPLPGRAVISGGLVALALGIVISGVLAFRRARTTVNPLSPGDASSLVVVGIYKVTRNPMYLGFALMLVGWAVYLAHPIALLGVPGFAAYMTNFQIQPEERALDALFGADFTAYKARVRRWI